MFEAMSLDELRDTCRQYKLDDRGDKKQLIERVQAFRAKGRRFEASKPPKVAYHPNVRCRRGDGCTCSDGGGPVIVGPMYRVGEVCVCEGAASEEEKKANNPVEPAKNNYDLPLKGFDLRSWHGADILGLRGADGRLALNGAILCGVDLTRAELRGANLEDAQLQGVDLRGAQLQGVNLCFAQLQAAILGGAQLQGAHLAYAQLQGADLSGARLQGAWLMGAQLQGANLWGAHLSMLRKGFPLPKEGSPRETEATEEAKPTRLDDANLSVLSKGGNCQRLGQSVIVSDAAVPTNLTDAKASGAIFTKADLSGATFAGAYLTGANLTHANASGANFNGAELTDAITTGATLKDVTLKETKFATHEPPERPASGALSGPWRVNTLFGGVARAAIAAADDDDDDDSDDDSEEEEDKDESPPVEDKMEEALNDFMSKLATASQEFMHTVDGAFDKVEKLLKDSLLETKASGVPPHATRLSRTADSVLADLLRKKLETANDKQAAILEILSTHVVSPLFDKHLPKVLDDAVQLMLQQVTEVNGAASATINAGANATANTAANFAEAAVAGCQLQKQLLEAFKKQVLGAGKAALMKRLKPIVCKFAGAVFSTKGRTVLDEEVALMQPKDSAACLVQELWKILRASLEAQARCTAAVYYHAGSTPQQRPYINKILPYIAMSFVYLPVHFVLLVTMCTCCDAGEGWHHLLRKGAAREGGQVGAANGGAPQHTRG